MNTVSLINKRMRWLVLLVLLMSIGIAQAQTLARPVIVHVGNGHSTYPSRASVVWYPDPAAASYEVFVKGPGGSPASNEDAWHAASHSDAGIDVNDGLMPGDTYYFRIRAIDAEGNKSQMSKRVKDTMPPCWALKKFWHTGEMPPFKRYANNKKAPNKKWAAPNIPGCEDSRPKTGKWALPSE